MIPYSGVKLGTSSEMAARAGPNSHQSMSPLARTHSSGLVPRTASPPWPQAAVSPPTYPPTSWRPRIRHRLGHAMLWIEENVHLQPRSTAREHQTSCRDRLARRDHHCASLQAALAAREPPRHSPLAAPGHHEPPHPLPRTGPPRRPVPALDRPAKVKTSFDTSSPDRVVAVPDDPGGLAETHSTPRVTANPVARQPCIPPS